MSVHIRDRRVCLSSSLLPQLAFATARMPRDAALCSSAVRPCAERHIADGCRLRNSWFRRKRGNTPEDDAQTMERVSDSTSKGTQPDVGSFRRRAIRWEVSKEQRSATDQSHRINTLPRNAFAELSPASPTCKRGCKHGLHQVSYRAKPNKIRQTQHLVFRVPGSRCSGRRLLRIADFAPTLFAVVRSGF